MTVGDLPNADQASLVPNVMPAARGSSRERAETVLAGSVSAAFLSARVEPSAVGGSPNPSFRKQDPSRCLEANHNPDLSTITLIP